MGKLVDQSLVTVKPIAYYKMLLHILRFGSKYLNPYEYKEVMGMLIGHLEGEGAIKNVIIEDVVPVSHGGSIEVNFNQEELGAFGDIDRQIFENNADKNWFTVGWYHSHPGLNTFFSSTDIHNQLFWQQNNPSGIGLVFDHTYLERPGDMGFRAYRLDDPSKSLKSDYHEVKSVVEPPNELSFYYKLIELITKVYKKEPPIYELNETTQLFSDILIPEEKEFIIKRPELDEGYILNSIKQGLISLLDMSLQPLINVINSWSQELTNKIYYNTTKMRSDLTELRDSLRESVFNIERNYNYSLYEKLQELDLFIGDRLEILDKLKEEYEQLILTYKEQFNKNLTEIFDQTYKSSIEQIHSNLENNISKLIEIETATQTNKQGLLANNEEIKQILNIIDPTKTRILTSIKEGHNSILENFKKKLKSLGSIFINLEKSSKNILADLKAAILILEGSKDPILVKMEKLENEKKDLHNNVRQLKSENKELLQKIKELSKGD